jgi:hypothetical protein
MRRACVGDVCISWSNLVVGLGKWQKPLNYYSFYHSMISLTREKVLPCINMQWQKGFLACKDAYVFSTWCYSSFCNTLLILKFELRWALLSKEYEEVDFISILYLDLMPIFILINNILCVCLLLTCRLWFITTIFMREGDQVKPWSSVHLLIIRSSLVTLCFLTFSTLNMKSTKKIMLLTLFTLVL